MFSGEVTKPPTQTTWRNKEFTSWQHRSSRVKQPSSRFVQGGATKSTKTQVIFVSSPHNLLCWHRPQGSGKVPAVVQGIKPGHSNSLWKERDRLFLLICHRSLSSEAPNRFQPLPPTPCLTDSLTRARVTGLHLASQCHPQNLSWNQYHLST